MDFGWAASINPELTRYGELAIVLAVTRQGPIGVDLEIPVQPGLREPAHPGATFRPSRVQRARPDRVQGSGPSGLSGLSGQITVS